MVGKSRYVAVAVGTATTLLMGAAWGGDAIAKPKPKPTQTPTSTPTPAPTPTPSPTPTPTSWQDPLCYVDGGPWPSSPQCTPPSEVPQSPPTELTCEGAVFCEATYEEMEAAGFDTTQMQLNDQRTLATMPVPTEAEVAAAGAAVSSTFYNGWVNFYVYYNTNCAGTKRDSNYCGWLYHKYQAIISGVPKPPIYTSSYPGRSGNNNVAQKWTPNVGPLPNTWGSSTPSLPSPTRRWGWMNGSFTGYEASGSDTFYPGLWRLDPWTVYSGTGGSGTMRNAFEIHGGRNAHDFWLTGTHGCVRLPSTSITSLKSMWDSRTDDKHNPYAPMTVYYP
jgi:hypothetical protein